MLRFLYSLPPFFFSFFLWRQGLCNTSGGLQQTSVQTCHSHWSRTAETPSCIWLNSPVKLLMLHHRLFGSLKKTTLEIDKKIQQWNKHHCSKSTIICIPVVPSNDMYMQNRIKVVGGIGPTKGSNKRSVGVFLLS